MRPLLIHTHRFPPRGFHAITLFPFVFYNGGRMTERDIRHETVHLWQQVALLVFPFYILYLMFWIINLIRFHDDEEAYMNIPFERSAYFLETRAGTSRSAMAFDWLKRTRS